MLRAPAQATPQACCDEDRAVLMHCFASVGVPEAGDYAPVHEEPRLRRASGTLGIRGSLRCQVGCSW